MRRAPGWLVAAMLLVGVVVGGAVGVVAGLGLSFGSSLNPDPESVASASLRGLRAQNRLTPFAARFVAVVTSRQTRFGLTASKTLIMPGMVRYELDLARLQPRDLRWDAASRTLTVTLPPIELAGPEVDLAAVQEYSGGGVLMALTDAAARLDAANRARGQAALLAQARAPVPMRLARDAARAAVSRDFALPIEAVGAKVTVVARFATDGMVSREDMDRSRDPAAVLRDAGR